MRAALRQLLADEPGLTVGGEAADTADALSQMVAQRLDTVLVDPLLPTAADGTLVLRAAVTAGIHVVVLASDRSLRGTARSLGITAVLDKDGRHDELLAALRGHPDASR